MPAWACGRWAVARSAPACVSVALDLSDISELCQMLLASTPHANMAMEFRSIVAMGVYQCWLRSLSDRSFLVRNISKFCRSPQGPLLPKVHRGHVGIPPCFTGSEGHGPWRCGQQQEFDDHYGCENDLAASPGVQYTTKVREDGGWTRGRGDIAGKLICLSWNQ